MNRRPRRPDDLRRSEAAATMVEYALMMLLVALACVAAVSSLGETVGGLLQRALVGFAN